MHNLKLNLKHLSYFWTVASQGSIVEASKILCLTPQTISGQLKELDEQVGDKLFRRNGRNLVLTDIGQTVFSYADEMFRTGGELQEFLQGHQPGSTLTLKVGVAMVVPKLLAYRVLDPVLTMKDPVQLICNEAPLVDLLADLAVHKLDAVLADCPVNNSFSVRAYNHCLGESGISFFADPARAQYLRNQFPSQLDGENMLMPSKNSSLSRDLNMWFERNHISPQIVAEIEDRALMKAFGERGAGVFTSPTVVENDVVSKYGVEIIGRTKEITEQFYVISSERRIKHPGVSLITERGRNWLSGS